MKQKTRHQAAIAKLDIQELRGIIVDRALAHWQMLPPFAKRYIDLEDWIHAGVLFVAGDLSQRVTRTFDSGHGASVKTFVYRALSNFYKNELSFNTNRKRSGETTSWEELAETGAKGEEDKCSTNFVNRIDAFRKVQELHRRASYQLTVYLDKHFFTGDHSGKIITKGKSFDIKAKEFRVLARAIGVTIDDYRIAIHLYHELSVSRMPLPKEAVRREQTTSVQPLR